VTLNDGAGNVTFQFAPVFTTFVTYRLTRTPNKIDQALLTNALNTIEAKYPFSPSGVFMVISYGLPYFRKIGKPVLVNAFIPKLRSNQNRLVLEEAVPGPTDVSSANPDIVKERFNVPVKIEGNDVMLELRSDSPAVIQDIINYINGATRLNGQPVPPAGLSNLMKVTSARQMFTQIGLPRKLADQNHLPFADEINPNSPMWMGFADQHTNGGGPPAITTFVGNASARLTTARAGDYFDNGSIVHLSHVIEDLAQFYNRGADGSEPETFIERCQYMFRSTPIPSEGNPADQFTNGGGPAYIDNVFNGVNDAENNAKAIGTFEDGHRMGHLSALQRSSRAADGTPLHIRNDGPGFDNMDVPDGSKQPKLQFAMFFPTSDFFRTLRINTAALDLVEANDVEEADNGLERFLTATRRQNFLSPPRRHRAFPLTEFSLF
jgi:hypothetical protein